MIIWGLSSSNIALNCDLNVLNLPAYHAINLIASFNRLIEVYFTIEQFTQFMRTFLIWNSNFNYQPGVSNSSFFLLLLFWFIHIHLCKVLLYQFNHHCASPHLSLSDTQTHTFNTHVLLLCVCEMISMAFIWSKAEFLDKVSNIRFSLWYLFMHKCVIYALTNICSVDLSMTVWHQY